MSVVSPKVSPRVEWMKARARGDSGTAEAFATRILAKVPDDLVLRRSLARILDLQGRTAEAQDHWLYLRNADEGDFEAAFQVFMRLVAAGQNPVAAVIDAAPGGTPAFRDSLVAALAEPAPMLEGEFLHIAICGTAYCGSTLLDRLLGGLPGVRSIGESHWLTKVRHDNRYCDAIMSAPLDGVRWVPCTVCGQKCEVLTPDWRRSLVADQTHWYRKVAHRLGTSMLVSADKNLPKLVEKDPLLEMGALVVFKSPAQAWCSHLDKLAKDRDAEWYLAECSRYLDNWARSYRGFVDNFRPQGPVVFLSFEAFTQDPASLLPAVCSRLGLPYDAGVLARTLPGHAIGGNAGSMRRLRELDYGVSVRPLPDPSLDAAQSAAVASHAEAQRTWTDMMAAHHTLTSPIAA
ncbi:hypothetical protein [Novosphingobium cyanobacteriorum]|uniref:Sulfotransferase family protein n=1 Tax=Novosphingobium cyanobacteriorum TaxID=3024215 RepID=A0ABT6CDS9_9SPHN|nr:hypothetical protein [Novosphingobium cyanobacteriorum]MDF8332081.1 hypothetical protein [Novosphingobium cyanobacteriorum]